jgi:cytochrome b
MVAVAMHVALIAVLGVLRGRCMACDMLPGGWDRRVDSGEGRD